MKTLQYTYCTHLFSSIVATAVKRKAAGAETELGRIVFVDGAARGNPEGCPSTALESG